MTQRFKVGDRVRVTCGRLSGAEGYIESIVRSLIPTVDCWYELCPVDILDDSYNELIVKENWADFELEPVISVDTCGIEVLI